MPKEASNGSFFAVLPQSHAREGEREEERRQMEEGWSRCNFFICAVVQI